MTEKSSRITLPKRRSRRETKQAMPLLSLVICSRNDNYSGNSLYRLQTSLNYLAFQVTSLSRGSDVEIIVTDWGSQVPLRKVLKLTQEAARITSFLEVPPDLAKDKQQDSPFAEVVANNAAIRRARGMYIGRIDQDTLVGRRFLSNFFKQVAGRPHSSTTLDSAFLFVGRRQVPLGFVRQSPSLDLVVSYIESFRSILPYDGIAKRPWFDAGVGVVLMHRDLWHKCRGYDESLLYWGFMETDLGLRIGRRYSMINAAPMLTRDLFHLSHTTQRFKLTNRKKNARISPQTFAPNDQNWGLMQYKLERCSAIPSGPISTSLSKPHLGKWFLRATYGKDVIQECFREAVLAGMRFCRNLVLRDRIQSPSKSPVVVNEDRVTP